MLTLDDPALAPWRAHPLCGPAARWPGAFWGPERLDPGAFGELVDLLEPAAEIAALTAALAGAATILDVGGGTGLLTRALARTAAVTVIEPSAAQRARFADAARGDAALARVEVRAGRAEDVPLPAASVDAALATWVLQYCDEPGRAIGELARVARRAVVLVQAAPGNDLVEIYDREAAVAGLPPAHHGWLLAQAAAALTAAGFAVALARVAIPVRPPPAGPAALAEALARLHFAEHPLRAAMVAATAPWIEARLAARGQLADDGVLLVARRPA